MPDWLATASARRKSRSKPRSFVPERLVAERDLGLLDRGRKNDVEPDDLRAALDDRRHNSADLARPGDARRADEWRRAVGFLVECDDHGGRRGRIACRPECKPAQRRERIDGQAVQQAEGGRCGGDAGGQRDDHGNECVAPAAHVVPR